MSCTMTVRQKTTVMPNGVVEVHDPQLPTGASVEVIVIVEPPAPSKVAPGSFLRTARALKLDGPRDWSENFENYLYGNGHDAA